MDINNLTLKQKISQMFITGFSTDFNSNEYLTEMIENALGGIIFFSYNIHSAQEFKDLIKNINSKAGIPLFMSIDQEGGRVERTENIHGKKKYLSARPAFEKGLDFLRQQTKEIALELKSYGINMNFAPVLDVNTNNNNPIIGERAFSSNTEDVIKAAKIVITEYEKYNIVTVGKHFPGHGEASADSHKTLPIIDLPIDELKNTHIKPFKSAIEMNIPAIMVAHVFYPALEENNTPASISKKIINDILINELGFKGIIITDDMEMNGIKNFTRLEACIKAINAGINMFIFRDTTKEIYKLISDLEDAVKSGIISESSINLSVEKILNCKYQYGIIQ